MNMLETIPPFIWPDARVHTGQATYSDSPPARTLLIEADLISGLLVGITDETIKWINSVLKFEGKKKVCLVLVLYPAGPTRQQHLIGLVTLRNSIKDQEKELDIRLLPLSRTYDGDCERSVLPPTVIQGYFTKTGQTVMSIGSVGDAGHDPVCIGSLNFVFRPDDAMRDAWRLWFQYILSSAFPLTESTTNIPHLVPAKGDPEATRLWEAYDLACRTISPAESTTPTVNPVTGEVISEEDGQAVVPWDEGKTALDPLAKMLQQVYANGWLVTVDESTRIKPLTIPVKAILLGQQSERTVGAVTQKQTFSLRVLDDSVNKTIENCRKVTDVMDILAISLSTGNRWLPETAKGLLEKELDTRNTQGMKVLLEALGGKDVAQFINKRAESIRKDLNTMYKQLGQGEAVPNDKLEKILGEVKERLETALNTRIAPRVVYNRLGPPDLTATASDENWHQPFVMLKSAAMVLREALTDSYFPRRFSNVSFSEDDFKKGCDIFGDIIVEKRERDRSKNELAEISVIANNDMPTKEKCQQLWNIIKDIRVEQMKLV